MPIDKFGQAIPYGDLQGRTPQNPDPTVDNFLRRLLGGEGGPLGVLPQSPTRGVNGDVRINDVNRMLAATPGAVDADPFIGGEGFDLTGTDDLEYPFLPPVRTEIDPTIADPGGTIGQPTDELAQVDPLEAFGGFSPGGGVPFDQSRTTFPPGGQPATPPVTAGAAPPAPVPNWANRTGPGDILSGVMGADLEGDRPYEGSPRLAGAGAVIAPAAGMAALAPLTAATAFGTGVKGLGTGVVGGARQIPSLLRELMNRLGIPGFRAGGQATREATKAAGKTARGKVKQATKTRATKRTTKGKAEAARQRKEAEQRARTAAGTKLGGG